MSKMQKYGESWTASFSPGQSAERPYSVDDHCSSPNSLCDRCTSVTLEFFNSIRRSEDSATVRSSPIQIDFQVPPIGCPLCKLLRVSISRKIFDSNSHMNVCFRLDKASRASNLVYLENLDNPTLFQADRGAIQLVLDGSMLED